MSEISKPKILITGGCGKIGAYLFPDELKYLLPDERSVFLHPDDFNNLLVNCLEKPEITFAIAHAISDNKYKRLDLTETRELFDDQPRVDVFDELKGSEKESSFKT